MMRLDLLLFHVLAYRTMQVVATAAGMAAGEAKCATANTTPPRIAKPLEIWNSAGRVGVDSWTVLRIIPPRRVDAESSDAIGRCSALMAAIAPAAMSEQAKIAW